VRWGAICLLSLAGLLAAPNARAEDGAEQRADALFDAGKRLLDAGSIADACRAFAESYAQDPTGGTLLNLGVCLEREGKLASAVEVLERALARAIEDRRADRAEVAENHLAVVRPRLSFLVLERSPSLGSGPLEVTIDGAPWPEEAWKTPRALDPGDHEVAYGEPGAPRRRARVTISKDGETQTLTLEPPPTKPAARWAKPPPKAPPPDTTGAPAWLLPAGIVASVVGGIGLAIGTGFGVRALDIEADATERCPEVACDDPATVALNDDFDRAATASTASFVAGGTLTAIGLAGVFAAVALGDDRDARRTGLALRAGPSLFTLTGRF